MSVPHRVAAADANAGEGAAHHEGGEVRGGGGEKGEEGVDEHGHGVVARVVYFERHMFETNFNSLL